MRPVKPAPKAGTAPAEPVALDEAALEQVTGGAAVLGFEYHGTELPQLGAPQDPDEEVVTEARSGNRGGS